MFSRSSRGDAESAEIREADRRAEGGRARSETGFVASQHTSARNNAIRFNCLHGIPKVLHEKPRRVLQRSIALLKAFPEPARTQILGLTGPERLA